MQYKIKQINGLQDALNNAGDGSGSVMVEVSEFTDLGFSSTGSGPYSTKFPDEFITNHSSLAIARWLSPKSAKVYVNGHFVPSHHWNVEPASGEGHELIMATVFPIDSTDVITLRIEHYGEVESGGGE